MKKTNFILCFSLLLAVILPDKSSAQAKCTSFSADQGVVLCEQGIPAEPRWFADSRLAFSMEESGIPQVDFFHDGSSTIFLRNLWDGFRYYLYKDNLNYKPSYTNSRIWPFGIESEWIFDGAKFLHRVLAVDEAIIVQLITPEKLPAEYRFKFDFNNAFGLSYSDPRDIRFPGFPGRQWKHWIFKEEANTLQGGYINAGKQDPDNYALCTVIGATFMQEYQVDSNSNIHKLLSPLLEPSKTYSFIITFGPGENESLKANKELSSRLDERIAAQFNRYEHIRKTMPVLQSPYEELNNYMSLHPMYHEALKITDFPGAIRAKTTNYWVWGWDGMTNSSSTAYWGDLVHIKNMLRFYKETAHPEKGIIHAYSWDMSPGQVSTIPAQCMYITMLQMYYDMTNDLAELKDKYEFAKKIFNLAVATEVGETGLSSGLSLYPDFMNLIGETGNDISSFNNAIFYCAARSLNRLSSIMVDKQTMNITHEFIQKIEENYLKLFYDHQKGYVVSSVDATTLAQRPVYQSASFRWENGYLRDLVDPVFESCLNFYTENLVSKAGIRPIPVWCASYSADGNQLHSWWPVNDELYARMINEFDRRELTDQWIGYQEYFYRNLSSPEGVSIYIETEEPEFDRWTTLKGAWHAYTSRTWYQAVIHSVVGVDADAGGITFYPYSGEEMKLLGLHYQGKTFDIDMQGSGPFIQYIEVNGEKIHGTNKLPLEYYKDQQHVEIIVKRSVENPTPVIVKYGAGIVLKNYSCNKGVISAKLSGAGMGRMYVYAGKAPVIKVGGKKVNLSYNEKSKLASFVVNMNPGKDIPLIIVP